MNLENLKSIKDQNQPDYTSFKPIILHTSNPGDLDQLNEILQDNTNVTIYDTYESQVKELLTLKNPTEKLEDGKLQELYEEYLEGIEPERHGNWVYYPWSNSLVHMLVEKDFVEVRTTRNKYKITEEEREKLAGKKIGIIGLSVGQSAALTIAMERLCGELRIADFDTLDLSNLNRIRSGVQMLGHLKTVMVAREIAMLDPYLKVTTFSEGITHDNLEKFLLDGGKLDLLADECDSMEIKFACRFAARKHQIPVVMDTSDRGLLDIERFDLEPDRKVFHGRVEEENIQDMDGMMILDAILDLNNISERGKYSLGEMGKTITSWPQLATSVVLGGSLVATSARKILLGEPVPSGRHYFDVEKSIVDK